LTASRLDKEGRIAIVTTREAGMRWTHSCRKTGDMAADERNRVVLISRRWDQVLRATIPQGDGG
jgi:hypothetical protein